MIRILSIGDSWDDIPYRIEGKKLLANQNVIMLRYLFRNEDESTWDAALVYASGVKLNGLVIRRDKERALCLAK